MDKAEQRDRIVNRAMALADSGKYSGWFYIQREMIQAREIARPDNPLNDFFLQIELDARCFAARKKR
jgi:hypothetical protein